MASAPPLPHPHPRIVLADLSPSEIIHSTACWRRYVGSWEIKEQRLWLIGLTGAWKLEGHEPLWADWFSGVLRVPSGPLLEYVHQGFGSVYAEELLIKVEKGDVAHRERVDHRPRVAGWVDIRRGPGARESRPIFPGKDVILNFEGLIDPPRIFYCCVRRQFFVVGFVETEDAVDVMRRNGVPVLGETELKEDEDLQIGDVSLRLVISPHEGVEPSNNSK